MSSLVWWSRTQRSDRTRSTSNVQWTLSWSGRVFSDGR